jgi:DNA-binding response OmpR family regulator
MIASQQILAVVQSDLQLISSLRTLLESNNVAASVARNSQEAILYLRGVGIYANRLRYPQPSILVLDSLNPDGADLDVLSWVRSEPEFADMPVLILCTERHSPAHVTCMLDPNSFVVDRAHLDDLLDALRLIDERDRNASLA